MSVRRPQKPSPQDAAALSRPRRLTETPAHAYWQSAQPGTTPAEVMSRGTAEDRYSQETGAVMHVPQAYEVDPNAWLLLVDADVFSEYGVTLGPNGWVTPQSAQEVLQMTALREAGPEATQTVPAVATRYQDLEPDAPSAVRGDGRAALLGGPVSGPDGQLGQVRAKGVPTGLRPIQISDDDSHANGSIHVEAALSEALSAAFLHANGIHTTRVAAISASPDRLDFVQRNLVDQPDGTKAWNESPRQAQRANALLVGMFDRLAHSEHALHHGADLRETLDDLNYQVSSELGRTRLLSHPALFLTLLRRKADELADLYWLRAMHGSPTYDNVGWLQLVDTATVAALDRAHPHYKPVHTSPGYAKEPNNIRLFTLGGGAITYFQESATPEERAVLDAIDVPRAGVVWVQRRMGTNLLETMGLDPDQARALQAKLPRETLALLQCVKKDGEVIATGHTWEMGGPGPTERIERPARYDIFAALAALPVVFSDPGKSDAERRAALVEALAPIDPDPERDDKVAGRLLKAAQPLFAEHLKELGDEGRAAALSLMADLARRTSAPTPDQMPVNKHLWIADKLQAVRSGKISPVRLTGEYQALARANIRRGPRSPGAIAAAIRSGELPTDASGRVRLSEVVEHGARLEELSDGVQDVVRISLAANPLKLKNLDDYRLELSLAPGYRQELKPTVAEDGSVTFQLDVRAPPEQLQFRFFNAKDRLRRWDIAGMPFGVGHQPLLQVPAVRAELGAWAERKGVHRAEASEALLEATALSRKALRQPLTVPPSVRAPLERAAEASRAAKVGEPMRLPNGAFGLPVEDAQGQKLLMLAPDGGRVHAVQGSFLDAYWPLSLELGAPVEDERRPLLGKGSQRFEHGVLVCSRRGEVRVELDAAATPG